MLLHCFILFPQFFKIYISQICLFHFVFFKFVCVCFSKTLFFSKSWVCQACVLHLRVPAGPPRGLRDDFVLHARRWTPPSVRDILHKSIKYHPPVVPLILIGPDRVAMWRTHAWFVDAGESSHEGWVYKFSWGRLLCCKREVRAGRCSWGREVNESGRERGAGIIYTSCY